VDNEAFIEVLKKIRVIYINLFYEEPTPDEEIESKEKLVNLLTDLLDNISGFENSQDLISNTLETVKNWDTLDLWFKEVEGLHENIEKILALTEDTKVRKEEAEGVEQKGEEVKVPADLDIKQIVTQVSEEFKGEISKLKDHITELETKLKEKDESLETAKKKTFPAPAPKRPTTKTKSRLEPPKIVIPQIGAEKKPKERKKPESVKTVEIKPLQIELPKPPDKDKKLTPLPDKVISISKVQETKPKIAPVKSEIPIITPVSDKKPIITPAAEEKPKITPVSDKKPKITPVTEEKPKITPVSDKKPKITPIIEEKPKITPVSDQKPKITPIVSEESPSSDEELAAIPANLEAATARKKESDQEKLDKVSSATKLFNVFSGAAGNEEEVGQEKRTRKRGEAPGAAAVSVPPIEKPISSSISEGNLVLTPDMLPKDKDKLYQELIALEGRRYSIEKTQKNLENRLEKGQLDEMEFQEEMDKVKAQFGEITSSINEIRKIIQDL